MFASRGALHTAGGGSTSKGGVYLQGAGMWGSLLRGVSIWGVDAPVVASSGGHCSSRYASYWNAFLYSIFFRPNIYRLQQ